LHLPIFYIKSNLYSLIGPITCFIQLVALNKKNVDVGSTDTVWHYTNVGPTSKMVLGQHYIVTLDWHIDNVIPTLDQPMVAIQYLYIIW